MGSSDNPEERSLADPQIRVTPPTAKAFGGDPGMVPGDRVVSITDARPAAPVQQERVSRATVWLHRLSLVIFVIFCIELGMLLAVLPWTPVWVNNGLISDMPALKAFLQGNFVRGIVTGCGLIDIWIGIWEAVHYRDPK